jgi:hypothetical protein
MALSGALYRPPTTLVTVELTSRVEPGGRRPFLAQQKVILPESRRRIGSRQRVVKRRNS